MKSTAVVVARFQTPYLHEGHRSLLDRIRLKHHRVVVVLGVSPLKGSRRNPYDFYTRERMLRQAYPDLFVLPLADHPSDTAWSAHLDALLRTSFPNEAFLLYGSRDSFAAAYSGSLPVEALPEQSSRSATDVRAEHSDQVLDSVDFRLGINYAVQNAYTKIYPTVDVAVFAEGRTQLLLGRKRGRPEWRLPGGFADATDADFEAAARRELTEECGPLEIGPLRYVGSAKIDDWRYRAEVDKIMTLLFAADLLYGRAQAGDDLETVEWFAVDGLESMIRDGKVSKEHVPLLNMLQYTAKTNGEQLTTKILAK